MDEIIGFNELKVGQRVNVKGKLAAEGTFVAVEIEMQPPKDHTEIEGLLQSIDRQNRTLRLLNRQFALPENVPVLDLNHNVISLQDLKAMTVVKLIGRYSASSGLVTEHIKIKKAKSFVIEKLKGNIEKIDFDKKTLALIGFTVQANAKTTVETLE